MTRANRPKIKYHNRIKVLLCYGLTWGAALLLPLTGLWLLYPAKLAGTAPDLTATLEKLPFLLPDFLRNAVQATSLTTGIQQGALYTALARRELVWRAVVAGLFGAAWIISLLWQVLWRIRFAHPRQAARSALRARRSYRLSMLGIWLVCALLALFLYGVGVRLIADRTPWDYLAYFSGFVLPPLAAMLCFRLAAPPALSGKHAFFRRL